MKQAIWIIIILIILIALGVGMKGEKDDGEVIKIGFIGPLTGDGAAWGEIERNAIELAIGEVNEEGDIGKELKLIAEDGKCTGKDAVNAFNKLHTVDAVKIILVSCSQEILPIAPLAEENKVLLLTSYAAASSISEAGEYVFRNSYTNDDMGSAMAMVAYNAGDTIALISEQSEFATDLGNVFVAALSQKGNEVSVRENFEQGTKDFRTQITKILAEKPDVVVINPNGPQTGLPLLQQFREQGFAGQFVGNFFGGSNEVQNSVHAEGMIYVADPVLNDSTLKAKVFKKYTEEYGGEPDLEWPLGARYDAVYILANAIEAVGTDSKEIKDYLYEMPEFTGILGSYTFDDNGDATNIQPAVNQIINGVAVPFE